MYKKIVAVLLSASLLLTGLMSSASAAMIDTQSAFAMDSRQARISAIQQGLARADVQQAMIDLGVDPADAAVRVESLSDAELMQLESQIETLPAGGSLLALLGAVFVVLLVLELTGVIDIFKKT